MNNKDQMDLKKNMMFVAAGAILGFFVSIAANAYYDLITETWKTRTFVIFIIFAGMSVFYAGVLGYVIDRAHDYKFLKMSIFKIVWSYFKSLVIRK